MRSVLGYSQMKFPRLQKVLLNMLPSFCYPYSSWLKNIDMEYTPVTKEICPFYLDFTILDISQLIIDTQQLIVDTQKHNISKG